MKKTKKKSLLKVMLSLTFVFAFCVTIKLVSDHNEEKVHADNIAFKPATYAYVDCSSLNVRTGPGTNYTSLGTIPRYTIVEIASDKGTWSLIFTKNDQSAPYAYVCDSYLAPLNNNEPFEESDYICTGNNVNIRDTPGTNGKVKYQKNKGDYVDSLTEYFPVTKDGYKWMPIIRDWRGANSTFPWITRKLSNDVAIVSGYWTADKYFKIREQ